MRKRIEKQSMKTVFVSNYINHHQIPFCDAMCSLLKGQFVFIQTEPMEEQRIKMGWHAAERPDYVRCSYEEPAVCQRLIMDADIVLFGGTDDESFIKERLAAGKPIIRISERLYKTGQWKAVSPRGLKKKYEDHTKYRKANVYLLCAGAYVASDFHIIRAYPGKMLCWGYFPETRHYGIDSLLAGKGYGEERKPYLLWAARMIDWKHPELAIETARYLKEQRQDFHMDMIGDGQMRQAMEELLRRYDLKDRVSLLGYRQPEEVRRYMEKADVFLFTSDRQEGWGAVANEAMNSGCAIVADHLIGAAPYLIENGKNGYLYRDGNRSQLFLSAERLLNQGRQLSGALGRQAYKTITELWNAENAAKSLLRIMGDIMEGKKVEPMKEGPCSEAPLLREKSRMLTFAP